MTLEQLKMLCAVAQHGSVLAAAAALHKTQPTVSVALRKLEDELAVALFDRGKYRATLTAEGRVLCQKAAAILQQVQEFRTLAGHLATGHESELHVAIEASCPLPFVLQILRDCERKYPQTKFNLQVENIWGALDKLLAGEVALAISPWFDELPQLESLPLTSSRLLTVAAAGYCPPGAQTVKQMIQRVQIVVRDSSQRTIPKSSPGVLDGGRHWTVNDHMTKRELILAGMGWGRLHEHLIADELNSGALVPLTIENYPCALDIDIRAVRRLGEPVGPVAGALWDDLNNYAKTAATRTVSGQGADDADLG